MHNKHLPRVCKPIEDESFLGYLIRLAEANCYERPSVLTQIAETHKYISQPRIALARDLQLSKLSEMTRIDEEKLRVLTYPDISDQGTDNLFAGHKVGRCSIKVSSVKLCPECLKEKPYMRQIWDLTAYTTCAVHNTRLIDTCPSCNKHISWARGKITECSCGFDFTEYHSADVPAEEAALSRHIYNIVYNNHDQNSGPLAHLSLGELLRFMDFMAAQMADTSDAGGKFLRPRPLDKAHEYVVRAYKIFEDWPNNFNQFLDELRDKPRSGSLYQSNTGLVKDFGAFYIPVYKHFNGPDYDFVRNSFEDYLIEWDGGYLRESDMPFSERFRKKSKYVGINEASRLLEVAPKRIQRLLDGGYLQGSSVAAGKTTLFRIEKVSLNTLKEILDSKQSQIDVAKKLGVSIDILRRLVKADLVRPLLGKTISDDDYEWVYLPQQVDEFLNKIRLAAKECKKGIRTVTIAEAIKRIKLVKYSYPEIISDIFEGKLSIYGVSLDKGLGSIILDADEIDEIIKSKVIEVKAGKLTLEEAAEYLQVRLKSLRYWAKKQFLITASSKGNRASCLITTQELESFKTKYVITAPIARYHGMAPGKLIRELDSLGVKPVSGPNVDGQHQYLYLKNDIDNAGFNTSVAWQKDGPYRSRALIRNSKQAKKAG